MAIGVYAFAGCVNLTSVILGSVKLFYGGVFYYCENLTSIVIPYSVKSILTDTFFYCISLTDVYYTGSEEEWSAIEIYEGNGDLTDATIHYNYIP